MNRLKKHHALWWASLALCAPLSHAEILVLLPDQGPMAQAAQSVSAGFLAGYYAANPRPSLRFIADNGTESLAKIMQRERRADTQLIVGPLDRDRVSELLALKLPVPVLALNQVAASRAGVWEFALSPDEDARALIRQMRRDGVSQILLLNEQPKQASSRFLQAFEQLWQGERRSISRLPEQLTAEQGVLLLGRAEWQRSLETLPKQRLYTVAAHVSDPKHMPLGLVFCDAPALYRQDWPELITQQKRQPVALAYQRLVAFGADAWQLSRLMLDQAPSAQFAGRTGALTLENQRIERTPDCLEVTRRGVVRRP
ncbi:MAG: hypothetical protein RL180_715 [Pseudomonadota bacterium]